MYLLVVVFLILTLLNKNSNGFLKNLIENIDVNSIAPFLELLNLPPEVKELIMSESFKKLIDGKLDFSLISQLAPTIIKMTKNFSGGSYKTENFSSPPEFLSPIKDIAGDSIENLLDDFFSN